MVLRFAAVVCWPLFATNAAGAAATSLDYKPIAGVWPQPQPGRVLDDEQELEALVDAVMKRQLDDSYVPGAVVAVVKLDRAAKGKVRKGPMIFAKGYGLADRDNETPVDPERTLFRVASISKLFAWTAVMQLFEQNRLDLSADINTYLDSFKIPPTYPEPVTLKHLMTHTAGFEVISYGYSACRDGCCLVSIADTLAKHMPARVQPPAKDFTRGETALYTNTTAVLAAHIVARESGQAFEEYVEEHIFGPLGMKHSSFREPLPLRLRSDMSRGYVVDSVSDDGDAEYREPGFEYLRPVGPAAGASAAASDMARFMIAHLQLGRYGNQRILKEETARLMHSRAFSPHPQVNGSTYGFMEKYFNGRRSIWHQGFTPQFYSELYLLPNEKIGLFVAYNSEPPMEFTAQLMQKFMDHYFPSEVPDLKPAADAAPRAARFAGTYLPVVRSHTTWEKRGALEATFEVSATCCGLRVYDDPAPGQASDWIELPQAPGVFRREDAADTMAFTEGADGKTYLLGDDAYVPAVRLALHETPQFDRWLIGLCAAGFIAAVLLALLTVRRARARPYRLAHWLAAAVGAVDLAIIAGVERTSSWDSYDALVTLPWPLTSAMALSLVSVPLTTVLAAIVAQGWRRPDWSRRGRLWHTALLLPAAAFVWWMYFWNLIGFQVA